MSGSSHALNSLIKTLKERVEELEEQVEGLKTKVKVHEDRADEWMTLHMKLEDKHNKLKEEKKEDGCN
jgi:predicted  nucleic acid-binding Zn-ribbon protein